MTAISRARISMALGPSVRLLLSRHTLDPAKVTSTGPHNVLLKSDVLSFISSNQYNRNFTKDSEKMNVSGIKGRRGEVTYMLDEMAAMSIYARVALTQEEIDVINNGG